MSMHRVTALAVVAVLVLLGPALAAETVKIGDLPAISNAGYYIGMDKGFFAEKGIAVETERFASGGKMTAPLATGQIDVAAGSPSAGLFNAIGSGMDFKIVADKGQLRPGHSFNTIVVRKDHVDSGRVKRLRDLKGMKVAVSAKGINLDYFLGKLLETDGLSYEAVEVVNLSFPDQVKALAGKAIDAAISVEPWGIRAEQQGAGKRMFLTEQAPAIASFQVAVIMYSGKFMKERPKVARDFLAAYVKGVRYYNERGLKNDEVAAILSKHTGVPPETIKASIPFFIDGNARPRVQDLATFQDWFAKMGWVKQAVPMDRVVDLSFLE